MISSSWSKIAESLLTVHTSISIPFFHMHHLFQLTHVLCCSQNNTEKPKKYKKGENSYKNHGWTIWENRERDEKTIPTRSKVKYMYIYKSKYLHFYKGPILSIYLYWICTGDGITLHTLYMYIFTVQYFFSQYNEIIYYSK